MDVAVLTTMVVTSGIPRQNSCHWRSNTLEGTHHTTGLPVEDEKNRMVAGVQQRLGADLRSPISMRRDCGTVRPQEHWEGEDSQKSRRHCNMDEDLDAGMGPRI